MMPGKSTSSVLHPHTFTSDWKQNPSKTLSKGDSFLPQHEEKPPSSTPTRINKVIWNHQNLIWPSRALLSERRRETIFQKESQKGWLSALISAFPKEWEQANHWALHMPCSCCGLVPMHAVNVCLGLHATKKKTWLASPALAKPWCSTKRLGRAPHGVEDNKCITNQGPHLPHRKTHLRPDLQWVFVLFQWRIIVQNKCKVLLGARVM